MLFLKKTFSLLHKHGALSEFESLLLFSLDEKQILYCFSSSLSQKYFNELTTLGILNFGR